MSFLRKHAVELGWRPSHHCPPTSYLPAFGAIHQKLGLAAGQTATDSPEVPVLIRNDGSCGYWKAATEINDLKEASRLLGHTEEEITKKIYVRRGAMAKPVK
ncbi:hypothetical protein [Pseudomonas delhiensis]|uniref:hypothetical protein n=1 Tax=Pseudomonas delhiensis TaxID=366289 RepID=UPI000ABA3D9F